MNQFGLMSSVVGPESSRRNAFVRVWALCSCCVLALWALSCAAPGAVRIDGESLGHLPDGAVAHASVRVVPEGFGKAIQLSGGGITLPTDGHLTAGAGTVELRFRMPDDWQEQVQRERRGSRGGPEAKDERTLFYAGGASKGEVWLGLRNGTLVGVYGGGETNSALVRFGWAETWKPSTWYRAQLSWQACGKNEVTLTLCVDGYLGGAATGALIEDWPATCTVGARGQEAPWQGLVDDVALSPEARLPPELKPGKRTVTVKADQAVGEVYKFWTVGNFTKSQEVLDPKALAELRGAAPFVKELNLVYLLGGRYEDQNRWFLGVGPDGKIRTDFSGMIAQLKAAQEAGYVPRIVLDNVPYNMSDPPQENAYGNTAPPSDERVWQQYVRAAVEALVQAFGREKVSQWSFRVGTEPDLRPGHWAGTRDQYFAHYDYTVEAVTSVLPEARIGPGNILNPGSRTAFNAGQRWGLEVIDHAATGTNACTGRKGTGMTVFSCSWYGRVGGPIANFDAAMDAIRKRLDQYPQFAKVTIEVGEFAVLGDERGRRLYAGETTEWSASFFAALADRVYAHDVRQLFEWDSATLGVIHPRGRVIEMLERMAGGRRVAVSAPGESGATCGAIACRKGGELLVLVYNHRAPRRPQVAESVRLVMEDARMKAGATWRLSECAIDETHGTWAYAFEADCLAAGLKQVPTCGLYEGNVKRLYGEAGPELFRKNADKYARLSVAPQTKDNAAVAVSDKRLSLELEMPGHSVRLLRLAPRE